MITIAQNTILLDKETDNGRNFKARFLQAGLVKYDFGVCLLKKETIDKFVNTFMENPVIIGHKDIIYNKDKVGEIQNIWFSPEDGWYWCSGVLTNQEAIDLINNGYSVSCQYRITSYTDNISNKLHNGNPYDKEILDGVFEHLAIVKNPRYEEAMIAVNAIFAANEDRWITVHPNGEENKGRHLLIKDGENVGEALLRTYGDKNQKKLFDTKEYSKSKEEIKKDKEKEQTKYDEIMKQQKESAVKENKETKESKETNTIETYLTDTSDSGFLWQSKGTKTYTNGGRTAEVEEYGEGGKYRVVLKSGGRTKDIKVYTTQSGMEKAVKKHLVDDAEKASKPMEKTNLEEKEQAYKEVLKRYKENDSKRWQSGLSKQEYYKAWDEAEKAKKELTKARREYAESIMSNFEKVNENPYEERQAARRERYEELSEKAAKESSQAHQQFRDKMSFIPAGQPIHGERDARYREKAWDTLGRAVKLNEKSNYYADKAGSVGKAGISADDANAIAKLAQKYNSGYADSAEKRRIIDRVIDIHSRKNSNKPVSETTDYGFNIERNQDLNRLQLKFDGKPDEATRSILKSNGFRWSPREGAWQRQLNGNGEAGLQRVIDKLKASNCLDSFADYIVSLMDDQKTKAQNSFTSTIVDAISEVITDRLRELRAYNEKKKEKWVTIKGNHILLKEGESIADAFKRVIGVSLQKSNNPKEHTQEKYGSILKQLEQDNKKAITPEEIIDIAVKNKNLKDKDGRVYTAKEIQDKVNNALEYNLNVFKTKRQTYQYYSDEKGHYNKNRTALHKKILNDIFMHSDNAKPKNGEKPTFIMLGGRGGSGKSKFGEDGNAKVYDRKNYIVLDADEIKKSLPEYKGYNAFEVHEESSDLLKKALKIARKKGLNVVLDGTMSGYKSTEKKLKLFEDSGYNIEMYYMHLPREKSTERAIGRFMKQGSRFVPLNVLLEMKDNEANFDKLKHYASKWAFYNNDVERGKEPILVDKSKD